MNKLSSSLSKVASLPLPITILLASIVLGSFYYAVEVKKIDQQEKIREEESLKEESVALTKKLCTAEAEQNAIDFYKSNCTYDCKEGQYYMANYNNYYTECLQREGVE